MAYSAKQTFKFVPVNRDKPDRWKKDVDASVDQFNEWFLNFAPTTFRETRDSVTHVVHEAIVKLNDYRDFTAELLQKHPSVLSVLRMSTAPPIARDRLAGLAYTSRNIVGALEDGRIPRRDRQADVDRIVSVIKRLLDHDLFPWLSKNREPTEQQRSRAATIVADRLCGATSDPLIRNAQEKRQLAVIESFLTSRGYKKKSHPSGQPIQNMESGTFTFRMIVVAGVVKRATNIPIDVVVQPKKPARNKLPLLIEAKSAGDFTNVNKRRKEEAQKFHQLRITYGKSVQLILFLCGYFDTGYLGYSAAEGLDWVWEHRISDLIKFGL